MCRLRARGEAESKRQAQNRSRLGPPLVLPGPSILWVFLNIKEQPVTRPRRQRPTVCRRKETDGQALGGGGVRKGEGESLGHTT